MHTYLKIIKYYWQSNLIQLKIPLAYPYIQLGLFDWRTKLETQTMAVLSKEETALISASWDLVAMDIPGNGSKFFIL